MVNRRGGGEEVREVREGNEDERVKDREEVRGGGSEAKAQVKEYDKIRPETIEFDPSIFPIRQKQNELERIENRGTKQLIKKLLNEHWPFSKPKKGHPKQMSLLCYWH